jgi:hypothetical protein
MLGLATPPRAGRLLALAGCILNGVLILSQLACAKMTPPVAERIAQRDFPSIFQAWTNAENLPEEQALDTAARHDLLWNLPEYYGLRWNNPYRLLGNDFNEGTVQAGLKMRAALLERNPAMVLLAEVRYRDSPATDLPESSPWWKRDAAGQRILGWAKGDHFLLDWHNSAFRDQVVHQAERIVQSGVVDGIMLDWWSAQDEDADRLALLQEIRAAVGPDALILVNANWTTPVRSAPYINGLYMETMIPRSTDEVDEWRRATQALLWAESNLRTPTINAFEAWTCSAPPSVAVPCDGDARNAQNRVRATTTLVLTHSDGYALVADPDNLATPDHLHDWYPFWDKSLGRPAGDGIEREDGAVQREFEQGTVVYNPIGNSSVEVTFSTPHRSAASGEVSTSFVLDALDGDLYFADASG